MIKSVLWIRIRIGSDPYHLAESGSGRASRSCWSESGCSRSVSSPRKFQYSILSKNWNYGTFDTDEKDKTVINWQSCDKSKVKIVFFPTCVKFGVGSVWGRHRFDANPDPDRHQHGCGSGSASQRWRSTTLNLIWLPLKGLFFYAGGEWCSLDILASGCHTQNQIPKTEVSQNEQFNLTFGLSRYRILLIITIKRKDV